MSNLLDGSPPIGLFALGWIYVQASLSEVYPFLIGSGTLSEGVLSPERPLKPFSSLLLIVFLDSILVGPARIFREIVAPLKPPSCVPVYQKPK